MGKMSKKILAGLLAVVLVLGGILLYNLQMNKSFITTFYSVTVDKPVEDLRIVLLSDLHLHEYGEDNADLVPEDTEPRPGPHRGGGRYEHRHGHRLPRRARPDAPAGGHCAGILCPRQPRVGGTVRGRQRRPF